MNAPLETRSLQFALASRLVAYPGPDFTEQIGALAATCQPLGAHRPLFEAPLEEARTEYLGLFDHGSQRTPLYETEYGRMRGMSKGNELADLAGFYRAFGLESGDGPQAAEMADHVAVELEFYAVLLAREAAVREAGDGEGAEIIEDARRKFLIDHLGRVAPAIAQRENVLGSALYAPVFGWVASLVDGECRGLGAQPAPLDFHQLEAAPDSDQCCAAVDQSAAPK